MAMASPAREGPGSSGWASGEAGTAAASVERSRRGGPSESVFLQPVNAWRPMEGPVGGRKTRDRAEQSLKALSPIEARFVARDRSTVVSAVQLKGES
jgi:hypothetical protein